MSRNQRARRKEKYFKQKRDAQVARPSKSAIWNEACERADELIEQEMWSEARELLEAVDRSHPGGNCVLLRLADVYEELGESDRVASVNSRLQSNPQLNELAPLLTGIRRDFDCNPQNLVEHESQDIQILDFKIVFEPIEKLREPQVQDWHDEAYLALQEGNGRKAELLFKKCLEAAGDAPDLLNNLAAAYAMQGRDSESQELSSEVHARWPDYFFGRIHMAYRAIAERRFGVAEQYLRPMLTKQQFHITEFRAMATGYIRLEIGQHRLEAAQRWLDVWKSVEPDHEDLKGYQRLIHANSLTNAVREFAGWFRR